MWCELRDIYLDESVRTSLEQIKSEREAFHSECVVLLDMAQVENVWVKTALLCLLTF